MKTTRLIAMFAVLLPAFLSGCQTLEQAFLKPTASVKDITFGKISLESATLLFDIELENPYTFDLPLLNITYAVSSEEQLLFSGGADLQTMVPAKSKQTVSLPVQVGYKDVFNAFRGFATKLKIPYEAEVGLSFDTPVAGKISIPLKKTGQISVPNFY